MAVKAKLKVQVLADEVVIAESDEPVFWQRVLSAIHSDSVSVEENDARSPAQEQPTSVLPKTRPESSPVGSAGVVELARALSLAPEAVEGACAPGDARPYLHLDHHYYEAFRRNTPPRGRSAIPNVTLAGTLLALWFKYARIENGVDVGLIHEVLQDLNVQGPNAARSLKNCPWLQYRAGRVHLNPAKISQALAVARAFCSQESVGETEL